MDQVIYPIIIKFENIDKTLRALKPFLESTFDIPLERYSTLSTSFVIQEYSRATSCLIWQWILEKHNASKLCKFNVASSPGIETMRKIASWISRAPFPYSPQGDETIRYILYGVSRTFSSYCRILDSKGLFPSWIQLCRVYVSSNTFEIVPSQLLPPFFSSSSDFSRGNKQYSQRCWRVNRRFYDDSWHKKKREKERKKVRRNIHNVQNNTSLADVQTTPKYLLLWNFTVNSLNVNSLDYFHTSWVLYGLLIRQFDFDSDTDDNSWINMNCNTSVI